MTEPRSCQQCNGSLAGKRSDAKFCGVNCRNLHFKHRVGRTEAIAVKVLIERDGREALIEDGSLNMQDEHSPAKVREAFLEMWDEFIRKNA
ncbi:hypothetical protein [Mesorhizobium sp. AA23]|uniref:hypothetical protein n=1 Tax=Mesorhizobium sp. AA23 TaxID=1854058 RepID=UPI000801579D|nr:hypothetical protein [Mesorhizobium sp. AA23]OBQ94163.1 hypothetical protein A9K66_27990 [Mesorhizobium sp. AA23]